MNVKQICDSRYANWMHKKTTIFSLSNIELLLSNAPRTQDNSLYMQDLLPYL